MRLDSEHIALAAIIAVVVTICAAIGSNHYQTIAAFEKGYCEVGIPGMSATHWGRCPEPAK